MQQKLSVNILKSKSTLNANSAPLSVSPTVIGCRTSGHAHVSDVTAGNSPSTAD